MPPFLLLCADPLTPRQPDSAFAEEADAARAAGFQIGLLEYDALVAHDLIGAVRRIPQTARLQRGIYRGWMLPVTTYARLYQALIERGYHLIQTPEMYRTGHELPSAYPFIADHTAETVWLSQEQGLGIDQVMQALRPFGDQAVLVKDYVKSRKHEWDSACFIPSARDAAAVARVVERFVALQGSDLQGGLVFRAYVALRTSDAAPQGGMPVVVEYRSFIVDGSVLGTHPYDARSAGTAPPDLTPFAATIARIPSRFFTLDVAQRHDGAWMIVELGDGQVAGLPPGVDVPAFYRALAAHLDVP